MATTEQQQGVSPRFTATPDPETAVVVSPDDQDDPPESVGRRLLRPQTVVSFLLALGIVAFFVTRLDISLSAVWNNVSNANPFLFLLGFILYYFTFVLRAYRWRWMLAQAGIDKAHGYDVPGLPRLVEIMLLSFFVNCIIPAKLGDAYRCYLLKRDTGAPFSISLGTILAERLTDLIVLFAMMSTAGIIAFQGDLPAKVIQTMWIGVALIAVGIVALGLLAFAKEWVKRFIPHRFLGAYDHLHNSIFSSLRRPALPVGISFAMWCTDGLRLYVVAASLGAGLSFPLALFVALMSALLTTLPFTPAGLGVVEGAIVAVLSIVEIDENMGLSVAFMDRLIGYWSLVLVGIFLYVRRVKADVMTTAAPAAATDG